MRTSSIPMSTGGQLGLGRPHYEHRTIEEFVEDLLSEGKSMAHIMAVTAVTRWAPRQNEVRAEIRRVLKNIRKNFKK